MIFQGLAGLVSPELEKPSSLEICYTQDRRSKAWIGPKQRELGLEIETFGDGNELGVQIDVNDWQGYTGRKAGYFRGLGPFAENRTSQIEFACFPIQKLGQGGDEGLGRNDRAPLFPGQPYGGSAGQESHWNGKNPLG